MAVGKEEEGGEDGVGAVEEQGQGQELEAAPGGQEEDRRRTGGGQEEDRRRIRGFLRQQDEVRVSVSGEDRKQGPGQWLHH
eukprot:749483-Hanusia_phi.AAC.1